MHVDRRLKNYLDFEELSVQGVANLIALPISKRTSQGGLFGDLAPEQCVALSQIKQLIEGQFNGESGILLTNKSGNFFPVIGKDGAVRVVRVNWSDYREKWEIDCYPFRPDATVGAGNLVFHNAI